MGTNRPTVNQMSQLHAIFSWGARGDDAMLASYLDKATPETRNMLISTMIRIFDVLESRREQS